jgi:hypothetical protein
MEMELELPPTYFPPFAHSLSPISENKNVLYYSQEVRHIPQSQSSGWSSNQSLEGDWNTPQPIPIEPVETKRKRGSDEVYEQSSPSESQEKADDFTTLESQRKKHSKKESETKLPTFVPDRRNVQVRFGTHLPTYRGRIICKEKFGTMVELQEVAYDESGDELKSGLRFWCQWDGFVNNLSVPILEVMYPCC